MEISGQSRTIDLRLLTFHLMFFVHNQTPEAVRVRGEHAMTCGDVERNVSTVQPYWPAYSEFIYLSSEIVETFHETSLQHQFYLSVYIRNLCTFAKSNQQKQKQ